MLITTHSTNLKGRDELKSFFRNKSHLSETHFAELINSMLNKRDDRFYGVWQKGRLYREGDIVYYDHALWERQADREEDGEAKPGESALWKSSLKELGAEVKQFKEKMATVQTKLDTLQQELTNFKQQVTRFLSLLILGFGFLFLWLLVASITHLV
jgi:DNA repair exonuclease SbcCD ATPase subunit